MVKPRFSGHPCRPLVPGAFKMIYEGAQLTQLKPESIHKTLSLSF